MFNFKIKFCVILPAFQFRVKFYLKKKLISWKADILILTQYTGFVDQDEVDAPLLVSEQDTIEEAEPGEDVPQSYYFIMASQDQLLLNVTPRAINVLTDINKASVLIPSLVSF